MNKYIIIFILIIYTPYIYTYIDATFELRLCCSLVRVAHLLLGAESPAEVVLDPSLTLRSLARSRRCRCRRM